MLQAGSWAVLRKSWALPAKGDPSEVWSALDPLHGALSALGGSDMHDSSLPEVRTFSHCPCRRKRRGHKV